MLHLVVPSFLRTALAFVVVLGVLVFVHELGHYLAARWRGVKVDAFSIGFGRPLAAWTDRYGTEWRIAWLPLGGYVKLHGQERPEDASEEVRAGWVAGRTFHEKGVGSRAIVVAAGPAANFVLAVLLFAVLFATVGQPVPTKVATVGDVLAGSAAAQAGLLPGDRVLAIDATPTPTFKDIQRIVVAHPDQRLTLHIVRDGQDRILEVTTEAHGQGAARIGQLGITSGTDIVRLSPPAALVAGATQTWTVGVETLQGVWQMLSGKRGTEDLGGPLRIAELSGQVAKLGLASLLSFIAVLSINLGLINLFPVPVLDGGHLLFYALEALRGRPIPPRAQEYGFRAGLALLVGLFVFATWNDLSHFGLFRWVAAVIG